MTRNPTITIVQEPPVFLNLDASVEKAVSHIENAAKQGADIVAFAECWLPGYPVWIDFAPSAAIWDEPGAKTLFRLLADNCVVMGDKYLSKLQKATNDLGVYIVMGTQERAGATLYNTILTFAPDAAAPTPHRKLVPTYTERLVWGRGDGSMLNAVPTPWGNLGSLICWEHWMPFARAAMHAQNEFLHVAQWPIVKDMHQVASRHYAFEGRCAVAAAGSIMTKNDIMTGFSSLGANEPAAQTMLASMPGEDTDYIHNGGSAIIDANGNYLAEPVFDKCGLVSAAIDLTKQREAWQTLDTDGHYSRPDIFELSVNTAPQPGVKFEDKP